MYKPDIEDTRNSSVRSKTNQVDSNAKDDADPDSVERGSSQRIDFSPDPRCRQHTITRERKYSSTKGLHGSETNKLDDYETENCESDAACRSEAVVVDLSDWLVEAGIKCSRVALIELVVTSNSSLLIHTIQKQSTILKRNPVT